jgi:PadR family transcriptional regulator, regulatory protein PadR
MAPERSRRGRRGACPRRISRFVEPVLLLLLCRRPLHGYALMEGLHSLGFEQYPVDFSAVYRTLRRLEETGMVRSDWDLEETAGPPRRVYEITDAGQTYLAHWVQDLRATDRILHEFLDAYEYEVEEQAGASSQSDVDHEAQPSA